MSQLPADVTIPALPAGTTLGGTELFEAVQTAAGVGNSVKLTANQIAQFVGTSVIPLLPAQAANSVLAGPISGAASIPAFRALVTADIPWTSVTQDVAISALGTATVTGLQGRPLLPTLPTTSQVLTWNGSAWLPTSLAASGITSLLTGTGLTGGPITGTGTISLIVPVTVSLGGIGTTTMVPSGVVLSGANATAQFSSTTVLPVPNGGIGTAAALPGGVALGGANATAPLTFTAVIGVPNGGTGTGTITPRGVVLGGANATAPIGIAPAVNTGGNILVDQGTTANPIFQPMSGDVTVGLLGTTTIGANKVTYSKLQQGTGLSVLGVAGTAVANFSAVTGTSGQVLGFSNATTMAFTASPRLSTSLLIGPDIAAGTTLFVIDANTLPPIAPSFAGTLMQLVGADGVAARASFDAFGSNGSVSFRRANATGGTPTPVLISDSMGAFFFQGYNGTTFNAAPAVVGALAEENFNGTSNGTRIEITTVPNGTTVSITNARFLGSGGLALSPLTPIPTGGVVSIGLRITSAAVPFGMFCGTGIPTLAAATGSIYLRSDGTGTTTRCYINQNGSTTWTNLVTGA